jgi:hypothetical protein
MIKFGQELDDIFFSETDSEDEEESKDQIHSLHSINIIKR